MLNAKYLGGVEIETIRLKGSPIGFRKVSIIRYSSNEVMITNNNLSFFLKIRLDPSEVKIGSMKEIDSSFMELIKDKVNIASYGDHLKYACHLVNNTDYKDAEILTIIILNKRTYEGKDSLSGLIVFKPSKYKDQVLLTAFEDQ